MFNNTLKTIDLKEKCKLYMSENGYPFDDQIVADGRIHRFSIDSKKNKPDEWYIAHEGLTSYNNPYLVCIFGSWSTSEKKEFKSFEHNNNFNDHEKNQLKQILQKQRLIADQMLKSSYEESAKEALQLWQSYSDNPISEEYLKYTKLKGIDPIGGIRFGKNPQGFPSIVIPIKNVNDEIRSLQYVSLDNNGKSYKSFLTGGEKKGNFHIIGSITSADTTTFIVEGYATGVSVNKASNKPVVIAFDAGNLEKVTENIKNKFPDIQIIIAGDSDAIGVKKATETANKFEVKTVFPIFSKEHESLGYKDFNDLHKIYGIHEVQKQLGHVTPEDSLKKLAESCLMDKEEPCEKFKLSALPIPLREYISIICKTTNAHPIMVTSSVLTMVSAFVGTKVFISEGEYFQNLYPNLWILCIAKSGQFKTTALNKGAKISFDKQSQVFKNIKTIQETNSNTEELEKAMAST